MTVVYICWLKLWKYIYIYMYIFRITTFNPLLLFVKHSIQEFQSLSEGPLSNLNH